MTGFAAWGDEAGFVRADGSSVYLMSAVLAEPAAATMLREAMRDTRLRGEKKIHWRHSSGKRRDQVIDTIMELPVECMVVVRAGSSRERDERQRRKTFMPYVIELAALGCDALTLESRGTHLDRRDMAMLKGMRVSRIVTSDLRLTHQRGPVDAILWIADAVCGAVVAARQGQEGWWKRIESRTTVREVDAV